MKSRRFLSISALWLAGRGIFLSGIVMAFVLGTVVPLHAEEQLPDAFSLKVGGYFIRNADTIMRLDSNNLPIGTYIDFSDTLGGDTTTSVVRTDGLFRFNENHGLGFGWYAFRLRGTRVLEKDITWGNVTFPIGVTVDSEIKFDLYKLNYQYSLFHNDKVELGALIGFNVTRVSAGISGNNLEAQSEAVTAPLPVIGLFADYNFTPRFSAFYNYQWFFINYQDKAKGGLSDFLIGFEYRLFRHFSLGVAYNRFIANLELKRENSDLTFNTNWNGGMLYGALYF
jgi:hypothetical protein